MEKIRFNPGSIFFFIDETGDPGLLSKKDASPYYQLNLIGLHRENLKDFNRHFSAFRYFQGGGKELEKYSKHTDVFQQILMDIAEKRNCILASFILEKGKYNGPYLKDSGEKFSYDATRFRNFIARKGLEFVFSNLAIIDQEKNNLEIVLDRYLASEKDENNLKQYLRGNYQLPPFEKITQVDSEYCEMIQVVDLVGRLVKRFYFDKSPGALDPTSFARIFSIEKPDQISEKRPAIQ